MKLGTLGHPEIKLSMLVRPEMKFEIRRALECPEMKLVTLQKNKFTFQNVEKKKKIKFIIIVMAILIISL